jgi:hypothetical protein
MDDDIHDQLVQAYLNYFEASERFERMNSVRTHREVRKCLRDIRALAKERSDEVHHIHLSTRKTKNDEE